jgi:hypothetical protein
VDAFRLLDDAPGKPGDPKLIDEVLRGAGLRPRRPRIRCPKCAWQPRRRDRWICRDGCRHVWNTFETGGRCPACGFQWPWTACLACHRRSPHLDWYAPAEDGGASG